MLSRLPTARALYPEDDLLISVVQYALVKARIVEVDIFTSVSSLNSLGNY